MMRCRGFEDAINCLIIKHFNHFFSQIPEYAIVSNIKIMVTWTPSPSPGLQFFLKKVNHFALWPLLFCGSAWLSPTLLVPPAEQSKVVAWLTEQNHDFGDLRAGRPVTCVFRFQNTSSDTILLQTVRTTCGCTAARYPETPIAPMAIGDITVEYDAAQSGHFSKKIRVFFDRQRKPEILWISGEVQ